MGLAVTSLRLCVPDRYFVGSDMRPPYCYASQILQGNDPYGPACQFQRWLGIGGELHTANPLTTAMVMLPFVSAGLDLHAASALILGLSYALLAGALFWGGGLHRLLLLLALPSISALWKSQWSPLLLATALLPACLPLTLIKPHMGLPIALTRMTRWRAVGCVAFLGITLAWDPTWPLRWLPQTRTHDGYVPLLTVSGSLLLLGLWRWRDPDMRYLLLCALVPQKPWYDGVVLGAVLRTRNEVRVWIVCSWISPFVGGSLPFWWGSELIWLYVPVCIMLLARSRPWGLLEFERKEDLLRRRRALLITDRGKRGRGSFLIF